MLLVSARSAVAGSIGMRVKVPGETIRRAKRATAADAPSASAWRQADADRARIRGVLRAPASTLRIGATDDAHEREADRLAARAVASPAAAVGSRAAAASGASAHDAGPAP